jgi:hypothetical protein
VTLHRLVFATLTTCLAAVSIAGCGGGSDPSSSAPSPTSVPGAAASDPSAASASGASVDPSADVCGLIGAGDLVSLVPSASDPVIVTQVNEPDQVCSFSSADGGTLSLLVATAEDGQARFDGIYQFEDVSASVEMLGDLGFTAAYKSEGTGNAAIDGVLSGWYVQIRVEGTEPDDPKDALLAIFELIRQRIVPMAGATGELPTASGGTTPLAEPTDDIQLRLDVTEPASLATVITEESLGDGAQVLCPIPEMYGVPWLLNAQANLLGGGVGADGPLARLSLSIDAGITGQGSYDGLISMTKTADGTDIGDFGTIVVNPGERSGTFTVSTTDGTVSGFWAC